MNRSQLFRLPLLIGILALVAASCAESGAEEAEAAAATASAAATEAQAARSEASAANSAASAADAAAAAADAKALAAAARAEEAIAAAELARATAEGNEQAVAAAEAALVEAQEAAASAQAEAASAQAEAAAAQAEAEAAQAEAEQARSAAEQAAAEAEAAAAAPAPEPPPPPPPEPAEKNLTMALSGLVTNVDPAVLQGRPSLVTAQGVVSTLVRYTHEPSPGLSLHSPNDVMGELAESYEVNDDGSVTFTLREAMSPYGNTVTSADVAWSFDRMIARDGIARFLMFLSSIDQQGPITIIDDRTFTLNVTGRNILTVPVLTYYALGILDSVEAQANATEDDPWAAEWLASNSSTFGPYQVESLAPGEEVRLVKNPNYWNADATDIDRIIMRSIPDAGNRLLLIGSGDADFVADLTFDLFASVASGGEYALAFEDARDTNLDELSLNNRFPPFVDPLVREAVSLAIDREALIAGAYGGFGTPGRFPMSTAIPQPLPLPETAGARYDPDLARDLLAQAGYPDGFSFTLTINPTRPGPHAEAVAVILASQLREVGLDATIETIASPADFNAAVSGGEMEAWLYSVRPILSEPAYTIPLLFTSNGFAADGLGYEGYTNDRVDELSDMILATDPGPDRDMLIDEARIILATEFPFVPLVETIIPWVFREDLQGAWPNPTGFLYPQDLAIP
ncbi:MAG: ABC transporter substrate-binding protein [bacterium]|nr:ABC transporter substrate-binding protein [bacterium]